MIIISSMFIIEVEGLLEEEALADRRDYIIIGVMVMLYVSYSYIIVEYHNVRIML